MKNILYDFYSFFCSFDFANFSVALLAWNVAVHRTFPLSAVEPSLLHLIVMFRSLKISLLYQRSKYYAMNIPTFANDAHPQSSYERNVFFCYRRRYISWKSSADRRWRSINNSWTGTDNQPSLCIIYLS
jgi:hypothetical protein